MIVVDANVVVYWLLETPKTVLAERLFAHDSRWLAPPLIMSEIRQALLGHLRHGRIGLDGAFAALAAADRLFADRLLAPPSLRTFELASASGQSAYDCEYVALADLLGVPLVTADRRLAAAFPARTVALSAFA